MTANQVTFRLLSVFQRTVDEIVSADRAEEYLEGELLVGMAQTLGILLAQLEPELQRALVPEILQAIVAKVAGGTLLVLRGDKPTEH